jgi:hypothetical protein
MIIHLKENKKNLHIFFILLFLFLLFQTIPYLYGFYLAKDSFYFTTALFIRPDLMTYLAKINQGIQGHWLFSFDYSHQPSKSYPIYTYYIFLGHLARLFHLTALQILNFARILNSILMFSSVYRFFIYSLKGQPLYILFTTLITSFFFQGISFLMESNLLIASQFSAHLPLTIALLFYILTPFEAQTRKWYLYLSYFIASFLIGIISSFAVITLLLILLIILLIKIITKKSIKQSLLLLIIAGNGGGWVILFQFYIIKTSPELQEWFSQNTIALIPFRFLILFFSPFIIFAFIYIIQIVFTAKPLKEELFPIFAWAIILPILVILPFKLKTRFLIGIFPVIASFGILFIYQSLKKFNPKIITFFLLTLTFINLIFYNSFLIKKMNLDIKDPSPFIFVPIDVYNSLSWINQSLPEDSLILAIYNNGNLIPAFTSSRAFVGHWCETPNAQENKEFVLDYYQGNLTENDLKKVEVDYVFFSEIEDAIGPGLIKEDWIQVYQNKNVRIYQIIY